MVRVLLGIGVSVAVLWLILAVTLVVKRPERGLLTDTIRVLPDCVRLLRRLAVDPSVPRGVRVRLWLLFAYFAVPIDLVPDFIPVLGYADDAILVAAVLRSVVRHAGPEAIRRHWPGSPDAFHVVWRLARLKDVPT